MDWEQAAIDNLVPLSQEQADLKKALSEWHHTEIVHDYGMPVEICQLCTKEGLRYHFEIFNPKTENKLLVGSSCIERFDIAVYDENGEILEGKAKSKKLKDEIKSLQVEKAVQILRDLWKVEEKKENRSIIKSYALMVKSAEGLSPNEILFLFTLLNTHGIDYDQRQFKVNLRSNWEKDQLLDMTEQDLQLVWGALVDRQRSAFYKHKETVEKAEAERQEALRLYEEQKRARVAKPRIAKAVFSTEDENASFDQDQESDWQRKRTEFFRELRATPQKEIEAAECEICGQMATKWYAFDYKTKKCKCMDCYKRQEGKNR